VRVLSPSPVPCYSSYVSQAVSLLGVVRSGLLVASMPLLPMQAGVPVLQLLEAFSSISTKSLGIPPATFHPNHIPVLLRFTTAIVLSSPKVACNGILQRLQELPHTMSRPVPPPSTAPTTNIVSDARVTVVLYHVF
jgi:hypothetical protein